jgi:hypothetical protein
MVRSRARKWMLQKAHKFNRKNDLFPGCRLAETLAGRLK